MAPKPSHYETAERIIRMEGLTFALASLAGKDSDLTFARKALKSAIANALASEFERVQQLTKQGTIT